MCVCVYWQEANLIESSKKVDENSSKYYTIAQYAYKYLPLYIYDDKSHCRMNDTVLSQ